MLRPITLIGWWWNDRLICNGYFINEFGRMVPRRTGWMDYDKDDVYKGEKECKSNKSGQRRLKWGDYKITYISNEPKEHNPPDYIVEKKMIPKVETSKDLLVIIDDP